MVGHEVGDSGFCTTSGGVWLVNCSVALVPVVGHTAGAPRLLP